ncbi:MAG: hypothetical protein AYK22_01260 [Thermoplasmatales archaeon SG8-52-3]|nr:MAG: hypothetical protein AYK22_01260 [Thermoplasmatales archaeon SG8-52-3]
METVNIVLIIIGLIVLLFGIGAFLNPNFARWINAPGSPRFKAIIAIIVGIILMILSLIYRVPN